ncbi:MAG: C10 family peptidase, partial [Muribaculaceae bacterium]|nr:C10 family peptidase [Muribaculaceae bacterium]
DQSICIQKREWYDAQEWEDLMYTELTTNGPVFHTGASYSGGHAFVCDGYISNGYFHFNWGWGGMSDGYFLLSALNPGSHGIGGNNSGFNMNQMILQNLTRSKKNSLPTVIMYSSGGFTTSTTSTTVGSKVSFIPVVASYGFENYSILPIHDVTIGIKCVNSTNNDSTYISAITCPTLQPNEYFDSISVILPSTLKDGSYIVSPVYRAGSGEWTDMKTNALYNNAIIMTVNGSSITFANKGADIKIEATDITFLSEISPLYHFYIQATYTNVGKQEFEGYIQARFLDESGKAVAAAEAFSLKLNPQQQAIITYMSHIVQGSLSGGNYYLAFYSVSQREYINEPIPITVVEEPALTCSKITMGNQNSVNCNDVRVRATIICSASEYTGPIAFLVFNENNMYFPIGWFHSEPQYLTAGKTQNVVVTGTFPKGQVGQSYIGQMAFWGKDEQLHR